MDVDVDAEESVKVKDQLSDDPEQLQHDLAYWQVRSYDLQN